MIRITLDKMLDQKQMTRYRLSQLTDIKYQTIDKYYKNKVNRYDGYILSQICKVLGCTVGDLLEYVEDGSDA